MLTPEGKKYATRGPGSSKSSKKNSVGKAERRAGLQCLFFILSCFNAAY